MVSLQLTDQLHMLTGLLYRRGSHHDTILVSTRRRSLLDVKEVSSRKQRYKLMIRKRWLQGPLQARANTSTNQMEDVSAPLLATTFFRHPSSSYLSALSIQVAKNFESMVDMCSRLPVPGDVTSRRLH